MVTMTDIAAKAGVSRATVSHVLSDYQGKSVRIPEATRQRILETAAELGYRTNQLARSVASGKVRTVGYLVQEPNYEPYWTAILGALAEAEESGFTLKVLSVTNATLTERIRQCVEFRLSGIIMRLVADKRQVFEEANRAQIPVVTIDEGIQQPYGVNIAADDGPGIRMAIEHLARLGHSRIAFITGGFVRTFGGASDIGSWREELFRREMTALGLKIPDGYVGYETMSVFTASSEEADNRASVRTATRELLGHADGPPTAIFCWRDETAMVVCAACRELGLKIPEDISVVGFSDVSTARFFDPPLSTVKSPWENMGRVAMQQLRQRITMPFDSPPSTHLVATSFVVRKSSGPTPNSP